MEEKNPTIARLILVLLIFGLIVFAIFKNSQNEERLSNSTSNYRYTTQKEQSNTSQTTAGSTTQSTTSDSYQSGFDDGFIVGKADARDGRSRRGVWAKQNGERLSFVGSNYSKGYHLGYNEGYNAYKRTH